MFFKIISLTLLSFFLPAIGAHRIDLPYPIMRFSRAIEPLTDKLSDQIDNLSERLFQFMNQGIEPIVYDIDGKRFEAKYSRDNLILEVDGAELVVSRWMLPTDTRPTSGLIYFGEEIIKLAYSSPDNFTLVRVGPIKLLKAILDADEEGNRDEEGLMDILSKVKLYYPDYWPIDMYNYSDFKKSIDNYLSQPGINQEISNDLNLLRRMPRSFYFGEDKFVIAEFIFSPNCLTRSFDFQKEMEDKVCIKFRLSNKYLGEYYLTIKGRAFSEAGNRLSTSYKFDFQNKHRADIGSALKIQVTNCGFTDAMGIFHWYKEIRIENRVGLWLRPMLWIHSQIERQAGRPIEFYPYTDRILSLLLGPNLIRTQI